LILAEVRSADDACFLEEQRRTVLVIGSREPEEGVEDEWRYAAVYFRSDKQDGICCFCLLPQFFDLIREDYLNPNVRIFRSSS
jgi:hypothetical protein